MAAWYPLLKAERQEEEEGAIAGAHAPRSLSCYPPLMSRQRDSDDSDRRLQKILQGAFDGALTPLKDIQTNRRQDAAVSVEKAQRRRRPAGQRRKRAGYAKCRWTFP